MTTLRTIQAEIDALSERRTALWRMLSGGRDAQVKDEITRIDTRLDELWVAQRTERARLRFGERDEIVRRARAEDRLDRAA